MHFAISQWIQHTLGKTAMLLWEFPFKIDHQTGYQVKGEISQLGHAFSATLAGA
jgi:hypothetical protein